MNLTKKYPVLGSSVNQDNVSLTIKGLGVALIPAFIAIARMFGFEFVEADLTQLVNAIATIASTGMVVYGLIRKIINK